MARKKPKTKLVRIDGRVCRRPVGEANRIIAAQKLAAADRGKQPAIHEDLQDLLVQLERRRMQAGQEVIKGGPQGKPRRVKPIDVLRDGAVTPITGLDGGDNTLLGLTIELKIKAEEASYWKAQCLAAREKLRQAGRMVLAGLKVPEADRHYEPDVAEEGLF